MRQRIQLLHHWSFFFLLLIFQTTIVSILFSFCSEPELFLEQTFFFFLQETPFRTASNQARCVVNTVIRPVLLVWNGIRNIESRTCQLMHYLCRTKDLFNSDTAPETCPAYFVLSAALLSGIRADLQRPFHKACIYRLKWHMELQGHCFSPQPGFLSHFHSNTHKQEATFFSSVPLIWLSWKWHWECYFLTCQPR